MVFSPGLFELNCSARLQEQPACRSQLAVSARAAPGRLQLPPFRLRKPQSQSSP